MSFFSYNVLPIQIICKIIIPIKLQTENWPITYWWWRRLIRSGFEFRQIQFSNLYKTCPGFMLDFLVSDQTEELLGIGSWGWQSVTIGDAQVGGPTTFHNLLLCNIRPELRLRLISHAVPANWSWTRNWGRADREGAERNLKVNRSN